MSHHGESVLARAYPLLDICDLFVFRGADSGTVMIQTFSPMSGPHGFQADGRYEFHLDLDHDAVADLTFRVTFGPPAVSGEQQLEMRLLEGGGGSGGASDAGGEVLAVGPTETIVHGQRGMRVWAGRAADPFYINGQVIGAVATAVQAGTPLDLRALAADGEPVNLFGGYNVNALVVEFPDDFLPHAGQAGFWATTLAPGDGHWHRVQRCATPLIPTIFMAPDGEISTAYQTTDPVDDHGLYGQLVCDLAAGVAGRLGAADDPQAHGALVRDQLFPDILRYQLGTRAEFTFAGRNGRGLTDPVAEVMCSLVTGRAVPFGLGPESATGKLRDCFPYLGEPAPEA
ncbi:MAG TPA: DUF4331 family protein [Trebonia sp.]|nr:DUF4331 family protein [Trebonia sp.]